jgi:hypothetical protein
MLSMGVLAAQIRDLERMVRTAETELLNRESELFDLRADLAIFERLYEARIGIKLAELASVKAEIKACQRHLDDYRIWASAAVRRRFGAQYTPVGEQYRQAQQHDEPGFSFAFFGDQSVDPPLSAEDEGQLKTLYRQLCRRFHPDLAQDEAERACRTEMMARINAAYTARDMKELASLSAQPDCEAQVPNGLSGRAKAKRRLESLRDTLARIQQRLDVVNQELDELVHSDLLEISVEVKLARRQGRDLLTEMEADLNEALVENRAKLALLKVKLQAFGPE